MDLLGKLFGGAERVKILRLFILNPDAVFDVKLAAKRSKISPARARREIPLLRQIGFIRSKKPRGWRLDPSFPFLNHLGGLLRTDVLIRRREIVNRFARAGRIKLLVVAGLFIQIADSRADLLIVGDRLKRATIERAVKITEAEVGRELVYAVFETVDFLYRLNAYDKFIRDILDYPHERVIDRLNLDERGYPQH